MHNLPGCQLHSELVLKWASRIEQEGVGIEARRCWDSRASAVRWLFFGSGSEDPEAPHPKMDESMLTLPSNGLKFIRY